MDLGEDDKCPFGHAVYAGLRDIQVELFMRQLDV